VNNVAGVHITNVYTKTVIVNNTTNVSFNGPGGVSAKPTPAEEAAASEKHIAPTPEQAKHVTTAKAIPANHASVNAGKPAVAATTKPGVVTGPGVVPAKSAPTFRRPASAPPPKIPPAVAKTLPPSVAKGAAGTPPAKGVGPATAKGAPPKTPMLSKPGTVPPTGHVTPTARHVTPAVAPKAPPPKALPPKALPPKALPPKAPPSRPAPTKPQDKPA
jgi:hypothetical protein